MSAPLLAFLDGNGRQVYTFDVARLRKTTTPSCITAITSGRYAGAYALVDSMGQIVVFRVRT